jgi:alpha-tubulin suppressor-like RCC1 family protein
MNVQLRGLHNVQQLVLGFNHSMSIGKHGDVYSWGTDENGSLGHGFKWPTVAAQRPTPVPVRLISGAAGWKHTAGAPTHSTMKPTNMFCSLKTWPEPVVLILKGGNARAGF